MLYPLQSRMSPRKLFLVICLTAYFPISGAQADDASAVAVKIDQILKLHWQKNNVTPAAHCDDATFLRRTTLDLAGRIPTTKELDDFLADKSNDKRQKHIAKLITSPDFALHFGNVLDNLIQGSYSGNDAFVRYLRDSLREKKSWSVTFREMMIGPWKDKTSAANRFLDKRARNVEALTSDTARVFFGVDISCAKCHDHPLVPDWKQDHFYGMMSFFNRTTGGKGKVGEKNSGEVKFLKAGKETTAKMMFLSGRVIDEPVKKEKGKSYSRREQLVQVALDQQKFFSRAMVNRLWDYFFGRGLVHPIDQMHSGNEPAVPGLLEALAEDFAKSDYDLHRLITGIVSSRAYQLSSRWARGEIPDDDTFAVARLRPLNPNQFAFSLMLATGTSDLGAPSKWAEKYVAIEKDANALEKFLDPRLSEHQSTSREALFLSNHPEAQKLIQAEGENLVARLCRMEKTNQIVSTAFRTVLSRSPDKGELTQLVKWINDQKQTKQETCGQLVWALFTSAEFRFNH